MRGRAQVRRRVLELAFLGLLAVATACTEEEPSCGLAELHANGWAPVIDATRRPFAVGEMRAVLCVRGVAPCGRDVVAPISSDADVVRVLTDAALPWVFHLAGVSTGRAELNMQCPGEGLRTWVLVVR